MNDPRDIVSRKCEEAVRVLMEHCDSVFILATVDMGNGTNGAVKRGSGSLYAQYGSVVDWLKRQDADSSAEIAISKKRQDADDADGIEM